MKNPIMIILSVCACAVFPPLAIVVFPAIFGAVKHEQHQMQRAIDKAHSDAAAKRRAKAIKAFASA